MTCFDGKYHSVDSSEMSFKMAGSLGFREALAKATPVLLEPISWIEVTVPSAYQGDVMGDLNARRGRVQGTEPRCRGRARRARIRPHVGDLALRDRSALDHRWLGPVSIGS